MSRNNVFIVEIVSSRSDGMISLPRAYTEDRLAHLGTTSPALHRMFYPVELLGEQRLAATSSGVPLPPLPTPSGASTPSSGGIVTLGFAAASLLRPSTKDGRLQVGPQFAKDFGLSDGDAISVSPALHQRQWRVANRIEILPLSADESEVIEKNAYALQNSLMQHLRVVFPNQRVTLRAAGGVQATVTVSPNLLDPAGAAAYVLSDGTELLVAVKTRAAKVEGEEGANDGSAEGALPKPTSGLLRLLPASYIDRLADEALTVSAAFSEATKKAAAKSSSEEEKAASPTSSTQQPFSYCSALLRMANDEKAKASASTNGDTAAAKAKGGPHRGVAFVHPSAIAANGWCRDGPTVIGAINVAALAWARARKSHHKAGGGGGGNDGAAADGAASSGADDDAAEAEAAEERTAKAANRNSNNKEGNSSSAHFMTPSFLRGNGTTLLVRPLPSATAEGAALFMSANESSIAQSAAEAFLAALPENAVFIVDWDTQQQQQLKKDTTTATPSPSSPSMHRRSSSANAIASSSSSSAKALCPLGLVFTPTTIFAKYTPETQYRSNAPMVLIGGGGGGQQTSNSNSNNGSSSNASRLRTDFVASHPCVRSTPLTALEAVHGPALAGGLADLWRPVPLRAIKGRKKKNSAEADGNSSNGSEQQHVIPHASRVRALTGAPDRIGAKPLDCAISTDLCNGNTLLVGPKGSGKSTIAAVAALSSGRHIVAVDCAAPVGADLMEGVIAELNLCSPSLLLLDNFDVIASSAPAGGGGGGPPTTITPATDLMIQGWLMRCRRAAGSDIIVVATTNSYEELQPSLKLPLCFPRVVKVAPALGHDKKAELMRQLLRPAVVVSTSAVPSAAASPQSPPTGDAGADDEKSEVAIEAAAVITFKQRMALDILVDSLGKIVENYSAGDLGGLCSKVSRWYALTVRPSIDFSAAETTRELLATRLSAAAVGPIAATFVPRSQMGIRFLGAGGEEEKATKRPPSWDDAGGLADAKAALHDVLVLPLKFPKLFAKLPLKTKSGVLLHGPSGCGKTYLLSVAVAAEGLHCIVVNGPEIFGKYIGTSEQKIREIFESAQAAAPCVVFFDEFDSVAPRRGNSNTGVTDRVVNQLLCYLDGVEGRKDVYVVAATSRPDLIDPALLRPGRLDRQVECPMPDHSDRRSIFTAHLRKTVPMAAADQSLGVTDEDLDALADATEGFTSADIAGLVSSANSQVIQSYFKLSGDALLAQLADGGGVASAAAAASNGSEKTEADEAFHIFVPPSASAAGGSSSSVAAVKKVTESLMRNESIAALAAGGDGHGKAEAAAATASADFPKVSRQDILAAMEKFSRSRESQKKGQEAAGEDIAAKLKQLKKAMGTRQTSA